MARNIVKASAVRLASAVPAFTNAGAATLDSCASSSSSPAVRFVRNGDLVEGVEITCACGRVTRLECLYGGNEVAEEPLP
ncbi:MAG: hypothetical protein EXS14_10385 [Planctomycetes bacterium]|nr:hypothetical protein [Planctomycetota bacterium]